MTGHGYVAYFGDFEDAYRRADGNEFGYRVPEHLIRRREAAQRDLDHANQAIRVYIEANGVREVELTELEEAVEAADGT